MLAQFSNQESYYNSSAIGLDSFPKARVNFSLASDPLDYVFDFRTAGLSMPVYKNISSGLLYQHCKHYTWDMMMNEGNQYSISILAASTHKVKNHGQIIPSLQLSFIQIDEYGQLHLSAGLLFTHKNWLMSAYCNSLNSPGYYYPDYEWLKDSFGNYYLSEPFIRKWFNYPRSFVTAISYRLNFNSVTLAPYVSLKNREWGYWMPNDLTWYYLGYGGGLFTKKLALAYCYAEMNTGRRTHRVNCIARGRYIDTILKVEIAKPIDQFVFYNQDVMVWASLGAVVRFQKRANNTNWYDIMEIF